MHQTFYVDVDEEVNSVISRLRKSTSQYNILAVAQRALILQSSVSLRLIKKEMDMLKKKIMIVTQDERGLAMAKKVGFPTKKTMEEVKSKKSEEASSSQPKTAIEKSDPKEVKKDEMAKEPDPNKKNRLKNLGESDYIGTEDVTIGKPIKKSKKKSRFKKEPGFAVGKNKKEEMENLFASSPTDDTEISKPKKIIARGGKRFLWLFSLVSTALILSILGYLFLPKAEIDITPKKIQKNVNLTIEAQKDATGESNLEDIIKLDSILIEADDVLSLSFEATGEKATANKKARGKITILNNFSEASQILVATTRFLSEDGKLFRLTKSVTVPGMKVENGEKVTGEIDAEVIADQPGKDYNVDPTTFTIPGFEGGPKYQKFSAKSEEKMKGGGEGSSDFKTISQADIDRAEKESLEKIKTQLNQKIEEAVGSENVFSKDLVEYEILDSASFPEIGSIADNFEYQIKARAKYLTFSEKELDEKINHYMSKNILNQGFPVKIISSNKKYGDPENNFDDKSIKVKLSVNVILESDLDIEKIKQDLLGKNQGEVDEFIKNHPEIQKIDATITPSFLSSKIPSYSYRVEVALVGN